MSESKVEFDEQDKRTATALLVVLFFVAAISLTIAVAIFFGAGWAFLFLAIAPTYFAWGLVRTVWKKGEASEESAKRGRPSVPLA